MNVIIMFGPPGVGKGIQSKIISQKLNIPHISTGDILRDSIKNKTPVGIKAEEYVKSGNLVPDDVVTAIVEERIKIPDCKNGFVIDGFPRTVPQAVAFENLLTKINLRLKHFLVLDCPQDLIIKRLSSRRVCKDCGKNYNLEFLPPKLENICDDCKGMLYQRPDDQPSAIKKRLDVYEKESREVKDYYAQKNLLVTINAEGNIYEISEQILKKLSSNSL